MQLILGAPSDTFTGTWNGSNAWCGARENIPFPDGCSFAGDWIADTGTGLNCEMHLTRIGTVVTGTHCNGGTVNGTVRYTSGVTETILDGPFYRFYLLGYNALQFQGNSGGDNWCGARRGQPEPDPCARR